MWNGFANVLKSIVNAVTPKAPAVKKAPAVQSYVNTQPKINIQQAQRQTYVPPQVNNTSYSQPAASQPKIQLASQPSPIQQSGIKLNLPQSYGTQSLPQLTKPPSYSSVLQSLVKTPNLVPTTLTKPTGVGALATQAIGKVGKVLNKVGTAIGAPQLAPGGFGAQLQNLAGNLMSLPVEKVQASDKTGSVLGESSYGTWINPKVIAERKAWFEKNKAQGQEEIKKITTVNPEFKKINDDFKAGKISVEDYDKQVATLMGFKGPSLADAGQVIGTSTKDSNSPFSNDYLTYSYNKANSAGQSIDKEIKGFYNNIQNIFNEKQSEQQPILDRMWSNVENGISSLEDYLRKKEELDRNTILSTYRQAVSDAQAQIPLIEDSFNTAKQAEDQNLQAFVDLLTKQKEYKKNTYGEAVKQSVKNQRLEENRLRNVFSNLGTAESSSFIDNLTKTVQDAQKNQADLQRQEALDLGSIDTNITNEQKAYNTRLSDLMNKKNASIYDIRSKIVDAGTRNTSDLNALTDSLFEKLSSAKQEELYAKQNIYNNQLSQAQKLQDYLTQYAISNQLAKDQNQLATANITGINNNTIIGGKYVRKSGVPSDMWGLAAQLYEAGMRGTNLANTLRQKGGRGWDAWYATLANQLR